MVTGCLGMLPIYDELSWKKSMMALIRACGDSAKQRRRATRSAVGTNDCQFWDRSVVMQSSVANRTVGMAHRGNMEQVMGGGYYPRHGSDSGNGRHSASIDNSSSFCDM
eukprot:scaffold14660_cov72-Skeletonema_dohrnii-CCMP3373.AAC.2